MAVLSVSANGDSTVITIPAASKIALRTPGTASYALGTNSPNQTPMFASPIQWSNGQIVLGTFTGPQTIQIFAGSSAVYYDINTNPNAALPGVQKTATAKTVSATLTALELWQRIITVNQGGASTSALQMPLATDLDALLTDWAADDSFDFSLINISTVAAEDASITTNTGWTLVGGMDVASNAAATDKSAGLFRARKTAAGAWTLYRVS